MATARIHGLNINYEILGDEGPPVTLTTGGRRGYQEFVSLGRKIAANGFRVFLHDRRNTGASDILIDGDEVEEAVWADDLHELLSQHDALPAFIGGSSSGARTSILFGLRHPESLSGFLRTTDDGKTWTTIDNINPDAHRVFIPSNDPNKLYGTAPTTNCGPEVTAGFCVSSDGGASWKSMTPRPGMIADIVEIDLPRPRLAESRVSPRFNELVQVIGHKIGLKYI